MTARVIDGVAVAKTVRAEIATRVSSLQRREIMPGLTVILIGDAAASAVYVRNKARACREVGIRSQVLRFSSTVTEREIIQCIQTRNQDRLVHGILVQLPLRRDISIRRVLESISVVKDVDGFHLFNVGGLVIGHIVFPPCTPYNVQELLEHEDIGLAGKNVTVVGASNIVGKPLVHHLDAA